jgi:Zn-dependent peptidase ImmA (M78 family)
MAVRKKMIRNIIENLLDRQEIADGPVQVDKIAHALNVQIKMDKVDDSLSGFLLRDEKTKKTLIGANKSHHPNRQRFTIAHELGHFLLHKGQTIHLDEGRGAFTVNLRNTESSRGEDNDEREANLFAAELLMPARFLERDLRGKNLDLLEDGMTLKRLAKKYRVSEQALTFRLAYLGYITL